MKKYELALIERKDGKFESVDKFEADNLVHLLSQFMIYLGQRYDDKQREYETLKKFIPKVDDDEIPF